MMPEFDLTARQHTDPEEMRRFVLVRDEDETGISGVGLVAFGVRFPDGNIVTRWNSEVAQTCVWASLEELEAVHGHGGRTRIVWVDRSQPPPREDGMEEPLCWVCGNPAAVHIWESVRNDDDELYYGWLDCCDTHAP